MAKREWNTKPGFGKPKKLADRLYTWRCVSWHRSVTRKPSRCALSGELIEKGEEVYRPFSHGQLRMERVKVSAMEAEQ